MVQRDPSPKAAVSLRVDSGLTSSKPVRGKFQNNPPNPMRVLLFESSPGKQINFDGRVHHSLSWPKISQKSITQRSVQQGAFTWCLGQILQS